MLPKISVVTVCYNAAATISDTIRSVQAQDYPDVEHIIVDGNSTDGTQAVVAALLGPNGKFSSEPDKGLYDAMNKGIAMATGDVIGLLNADDAYSRTDALSLIAARFRARPELDAVLSDIGFHRDFASSRVDRRYRSDRFRPDLVRWGWMPAHPGMFLTRDAYARVGQYRTDYRIAADFEFVVRAFAKLGLSYEHLPEILVKMRLGGASTAGARAKWIINQECVRACRENGIRTNLLMIMAKYPLKLLEVLQ
jgi:glycosyltransferase involved in cell wall biosynthesis